MVRRGSGHSGSWSHFVVYGFSGFRTGYDGEILSIDPDAIPIHEYLPPVRNSAIRSARSRVDRDVSRLRGNAVQPGPNQRVALHLKAALVRDVRVAVEGDVRQRW